MEHINYTWKFESSNKLSIYIIFSANGLTLETLRHFSQLRAIKEGRRKYFSCLFIERSIILVIGKNVVTIVGFCSHRQNKTVYQTQKKLHLGLRGRKRQEINDGKAFQRELVDGDKAHGKQSMWVKTTKQKWLFGIGTND